MNFDEIKNIIQNDNSKFIIVENGKPIIVISSFWEYKKILTSYFPKTKEINLVRDYKGEEEAQGEQISSGLNNSKLTEKQEGIDDMNKSDIDAKKLEEEELTIEDLPFE